MTTTNIESFDHAPHFALNGRASDFASAVAKAMADEQATPDKSQGRQDRFHGNDLKQYRISNKEHRMSK
jgi:hypothetical protein